MTDPRTTSLNHRLRNAASASGVAPERMRNRHVFHRILARLARDERWILKGGFALETRLVLDARATKDLDILRWGAMHLTASRVQALLEEALEQELDDGFSFRVRMPRPVRAEDVEPSTWRVVVEVWSFSSLFGEAVLDIVTRDSSPDEDTDVVEIPGLLGGPPISMLAIDVERQAAEKFHAYSRVYAHERPSSRVKDLVDLALLIEADMLDGHRLRSALKRVFHERDGGPPPPELPSPPGDWELPFRRLAQETALGVMSTDEAWRLARDMYMTAITVNEEHL